MSIVALLVGIAIGFVANRILDERAEKHDGSAHGWDAVSFGDDGMPMEERRRYFN